MRYQKAMNPKVSVIIPVYNGARTLPLCLDSLMELEYPKEEIEIIAVDNNSKDDSKKVIQKYPVKYIFEKRQGRGAARNRGVKESKGELIAFLDADCIADKYWLNCLIAAIEHSGIGACGGKTLFLPPENTIARYYKNEGRYSNKNFIQGTKFCLPSIATGNSIFHRSTLFEAGLFDNSFKYYEDTDISWRICLKGYKLKYVPQAIVCHHCSDSLTQFCRKSFEQGYAVAYLTKKYSCLINRRAMFHIKDFFVLYTKAMKNLAQGILRKVNRTEMLLLALKPIGLAVFSIGKSLGWLRIKSGRDSFPVLLPPRDELICWDTKNGGVILKLCAGKRAEQYILNGSGFKIWKWYREKKNKEEILSLLTDELHDSPHRVEEELDEFDHFLKHNGLMAKRETVYA